MALDYKLKTHGRQPVGWELIPWRLFLPSCFNFGNSDQKNKIPYTTKDLDLAKFDLL